MKGIGKTIILGIILSFLQVMFCDKISEFVGNYQKVYLVKLSFTNAFIIYILLVFNV